MVQLTVAFRNFANAPYELFLFRSSVVGIVTRVRAAGSRVGTPVGARGFSGLQNFQTGSGAHPATYSSTEIFPGDKAAEV